MSDFGIVIGIIVFLVLVAIGVGIYFLIKDVRNITDRGVGESCSYDFQCANSACGRPAANSTTDVCCPSNNVDNFDAKGAPHDYCTGMTDGTPCWSDTMCASGNCTGVVGTTTFGYCTSGEGPPGSACPSTENNQCIGPSGNTGGGICSQIILGPTGDTEYQCCPSFDDTPYPGHDTFCTAQGTLTSGFCRTDLMCCCGLICNNGAFDIGIGTCVEPS